MSYETAHYLRKRQQPPPLLQKPPLYLAPVGDKSMNSGTRD